MKTDDAVLRFDTVRDQELAAILAARGRCSVNAAASTDSLIGLALSGGGIRSATFSLGVLQALAGHRKLGCFDYLSTVSGGGYIGAWLSAWINREGLIEVEHKLRPGHAPEADAVNWLRQYSNYLTPRIGLFSADSLTLVATWIRNVLLNLLVLSALLATLYLLPHVMMPWAVEGMAQYRVEMGLAAAWLGFFFFPLGISFNLGRVALQDSSGQTNWAVTTAGVFATVIAPALLATLLASLSLLCGPVAVIEHPGGVALGVGGLLLLAGLFSIVYRVCNRDYAWPESAASDLLYAVAYAVALGTAFLLVGLLDSLLRPTGTSNLERAVLALTLGPPAILGAFGVCGSIFVGLVGRLYFERSREWWGRMNAWMTIVALVWLSWFSLSFYTLPILAWIAAASSGWLTTLGGLGWLGSLLSTLLIPKPATTKTLWRRLGTKALGVAAGIVVIGFLILVAALLSLSMRAVAVDTPATLHPVIGQTDSWLGNTRGGETQCTRLQLDDGRRPCFAAYVEAGFDDQLRIQRHHIDIGLWKWQLSMPLTCAAIALSLAVFVLFGIRVDVNKFSLHNMYKNRLVRCYLGASRDAGCGAEKDQRDAQPFTGFDENDDFCLSRLRIERRTGEVQRPLHLINTALNITQGDNLAWQERKAASFMLSGWFCGFTLPANTGDAARNAGAARPMAKRRLATSRDAYRDARHYGAESASAQSDEPRFTLGMAMATSGAAASPNMGRFSSPALSFVLTLFNVRLGRWSPNPAWPDKLPPSPWLGMRWLLQELFGLTNESSRFVYLSDGGHFDNTGVYELVRRRCRTIVAVDAGADPTRSFSDMGNLVRKCRIDLGVEIRFPLDRLGTEQAEQAKSSGYVVGTIDYRGSSAGRLIVIKPTLPAPHGQGADIFAYSRTYDDFPHQTTADQFFDESQFESYRALGFAIADGCLRDPACALPERGACSRAVERCA